MIKKIFCLVLFCFLAVGLSGCNKQKAIILFNNNPITKETLLNNSTMFKVKKRIYYVFISQKPIESKFIRVIIQKREEKADNLALKVVYSDDFRLNKDNVFYYTDYIVMEETGSYCMKVYAKNNLERPLAVADFKVSDPMR